MEKKIYVKPEADVELFEQDDIMMLLSGDNAVTGGYGNGGIVDDNASDPDNWNFNN